MTAGGSRYLILMPSLVFLLAPGFGTPHLPLGFGVPHLPLGFGVPHLPSSSVFFFFFGVGVARPASCNLLLCAI